MQSAHNDLQYLGMRFHIPDLVAANDGIEIIPHAKMFQDYTRKSAGPIARYGQLHPTALKPPQKHTGAGHQPGESHQADRVMATVYL